jgi:hypothetical protein
MENHDLGISAMIQEGQNFDHLQIGDWEPQLGWQKTPQSFTVPGEQRWRKSRARRGAFKQQHLDSTFNQQETCGSQEKEVIIGL